MASQVNRRELLESEFEVLATKDPEVFFEAMLISLRNNTMEPLDNKRMKVQKIIFKRWFTQYEKRVRQEAEQNSKIFYDGFKTGSKLGKASVLGNIPTKRTLFGRKVDQKAVLEQIKELENDA